MLRLTATERAVAEIAAVAEHVASLTTAAAAFQLDPDVPAAGVVGRAPLLPLVEEDNAGDAAPLLDEVRRWTADVLRIDHVPAVWRALAHDVRLLEATWRKDRLILGSGALDELVKGCAALAVAQFRQSAYWIAYFTHFLRVRCGLDQRGLVEVAGAVMHYVSFNTIAHGMMLEPPCTDLQSADFVPGGRLEHLVPGVKRTVTRAQPAAATPKA